MSYAHQLLAECLIAQGMPEEDAKRAVAMVLDVALQAEIIEHRALDLWERDAAIYHLAGKRIPLCTLVVRFSISRTLLYRILERQKKRRRSALRMRDGHFELAG